jgi:hypothetical protein
MPSITPIYLPYYVLIDCCIPTCICTHTKLSKTSIFLGQILNPKTSFFGTKGVSWMLSWDDGGVCGGWGGWVSGCVCGGGGAAFRDRRLYKSIFSTARNRPAHRPYWAGVDGDLEAHEFFFGLSPVRNAAFSYFTLKNMRAAQAQACPEN